ncbi:MAG: tyrosine-type recombinase/integrase [Bryobacteraceae bacterium]
MAELLFTSDAFCPNGLSVAEVPILVDHRMHLVEPACAWLLYISLVRGRTQSPNTWRTYGEALYDWWQTLEANGWSWNDIGVHEVAAYRNKMLTSVSFLTGRPCSRSTINGRIRIISLFYSWCKAQTLITNTPFGDRGVFVKRFAPARVLVHLGADGGWQQANDLTVRHTKPLPRPIAPWAIRQVVARLNARDRLIVEWAVMTGARRMEIAGLKRSVIDRIRANREDLPVVPIRLDITKGGKVRYIYPPLALIDRTRAYIREERAVILRKARTRQTSFRETDVLFITRRGKAMTPRRVGMMFGQACAAAEVTGTFHSLRHTFAGIMLGFLQQQTGRHPEMNPLLTLQTILGHADIATTGIYLKMLATDLTAIEDAIASLYSTLI